MDKKTNAPEACRYRQPKANPDSCAGLDEIPGRLTVHWSQMRYTIPGFKTTWRGRLIQAIVDRLHRNGD